MSSTTVNSNISIDLSTQQSLVPGSTSRPIGTNSNASNIVDSVTILWAALNFVLFLIILGGNTLTIIAVRTCRRLRSIISNLFILSLAVSDLLVGIALPYHVAFYLGWSLGHSRTLCLLRFFLMIFACCVSLGTLISIAIDRYIAIIFPLDYCRFITRRMAYMIIITCWLAGITVASIPMIWNDWKTAHQCEFHEILPLGYVIGILTPVFVIIWTLMLLLYWRIMREASKQARQMSIFGSSDWKSIQVVVLIMGAFTICWLPYFTVVCTKTFKVYDQTTWLYKYTFSLAMSNSGLNPIIYSWKNSNFRKAFKRLICCRSPNYHPQQCLQFSRILSSPYAPENICPIPHNQPTVQNIIILPVCDKSVENKACQNAIENISHQDVTTANESNTCAICKCVIRNTIKLQKDLNLSLQSSKVADQIHLSSK